MLTLLGGNRKGTCECVSTHTVVCFEGYYFYTRVLTLERESEGICILGMQEKDTICMLD